MYITCKRVLLALTIVLVAVWPAARLGAQHAGTAPSAQGEAPVHPAGGLLLVGPQDYEPFSFIGSDGKPSGFDVDVVNAISQQINVPITVQLLPAGEVAAAVAEGKADGVLGMGVLPDQVDPRNQWQMCGPTLRRVYRIFINSDNSWIPDNANLKDLAGTRVAVLADDPVVAFLGNDRTLGLDMLRRPRDGCAWIAAHRVTAFVADENVIRYGARQSSMKAGRFVGPQVYEIQQWGPALPQTSDAMAQKIKAAIAGMEISGQLESLRKQWFEGKISERPFWRQGWFETALLCLAAAAALAGGFYLWRRSVLMLVERRTRRLHAESEVLRRQVVDLRARLEHSEPHVTLDPVAAAPAPQSGAVEAGEEASPQAAAVSIANNHAAADGQGTPLELNELIRACVKDLEQAVGEEIRLHIALGENLPPVLGQTESIRQMLVHLCANSRDAILERRRKEHNFPERIWVATRRQSSQEKPPNPAYAHRSYVALSVRDTGCGIDPTMVQKIFQSGYSTKSDAEGKGLTFVYETVAKHGGWIDVESAVGRGATISIYLPTVKV